MKSQHHEIALSLICIAFMLLLIGSVIGQQDPADEDFVKADDFKKASYTGEGFENWGRSSNSEFAKLSSQDMESFLSKLTSKQRSQLFNNPNFNEGGLFVRSRTRSATGKDIKYDFGGYIDDAILDERGELKFENGASFNIDNPPDYYNKLNKISYDPDILKFEYAFDSRDPNKLTSINLQSGSLFDTSGAGGFVLSYKDKSGKETPINFVSSRGGELTVSEDDDGDITVLLDGKGEAIVTIGDRDDIRYTPVKSEKGTLKFTEEKGIRGDKVFRYEILDNGKLGEWILLNDLTSVGDEGSGLDIESKEEEQVVRENANAVFILRTPEGRIQRFVANKENYLVPYNGNPGEVAAVTDDGRFRVVQGGLPPVSEEYVQRGRRFWFPGKRIVRGFRNREFRPLRRLGQAIRRGDGPIRRIFRRQPVRTFFRNRQPLRRIVRGVRNIRPFRNRPVRTFFRRGGFFRRWR